MLLRPLIASDADLALSLSAVRFTEPVFQLVPGNGQSTGPTRDYDGDGDDDVTDRESVASDASVYSDASVRSFDEFTQEIHQREEEEMTYQSFRKILENPPRPGQLSSYVLKHFWDHLKGDHAPRKPNNWNNKSLLEFPKFHYIQYGVYYEWFRATGLPLVEVKYAQILHEANELQRELYSHSGTFTSYLEDHLDFPLELPRKIWLVSVILGFIKYTQSNLLDGLGEIVRVPYSVDASDVQEYNEAMKRIEEEIAEWKKASTTKPMFGLGTSRKELIEKGFEDKRQNDTSALHKCRYNSQWLRLIHFHGNFPSVDYPLDPDELEWMNLLIRLKQDSVIPGQRELINELHKAVNQYRQQQSQISTETIAEMFFRFVLRAPAINKISSHLRSIIENKWSFIGSQVALNVIDPVHTKDLLQRFKDADCVTSLMESTPHGAWDGLLKCMDASVFTYEQKEFNQLVLLPLSFTERQEDFDFNGMLGQKFTNLKEAALGAMQKSAGAQVFPDFAFDIRFVSPDDTALLGLFPAVRNDFVLVADIVTDTPERAELAEANISLLGKMKPDKDHKMIVLHIGLKYDPTVGFSWTDNESGRDIPASYKNGNHFVHVPFFFLPDALWPWAVNMAYFRRITTFYSNYDKDYDDLFGVLSRRQNGDLEVPNAINDHIMKPVLRFLGQLHSAGLEVDSKLDAALQQSRYVLVDPEIRDDRRHYKVPEIIRNSVSPEANQSKV